MPARSAEPCEYYIRVYAGPAQEERESETRERERRMLQWKRAAVVGFAGGCSLEMIAQVGGIWKGVEKRRLEGVAETEEGDENRGGEDAAAQTQAATQSK